MLREPHGWFSPVQPSGVYENNLDCQWLIQIDSYLRVQLDILYLDVEDSEGCLKDFLQVSQSLCN